ncbi:MAG: aromatic amino acid ammonia-lyase [Thermoleophilia bacterium]
MTVLLDGRSLTIGEVVRVARAGESVELTVEAIEQMGRSREVMVAAAAGGQSIYGFTTAVGALKYVNLEGSDIHQFNRTMVISCRTGHGEPVAQEVVRGTLLRLANHLARGVTGARPELAQLVLRAINENWELPIRPLGSVGQADLTPLGDLAGALIDRESFRLEGGEGLALISNNAYSTAQAALAFADLESLVDTLDVAGALELEAFLANPSIVDEALTERPYLGLQLTSARLRELLAESELWDDGVPRHLQDPLTFRCLPQVHGAMRDALAFADHQLTIELNALQGNPFVSVEHQRVVPNGSFDSLPLAAALDFVRISLAPVLISANERMMKLLTGSSSGLEPGLTTDHHLGHDGYNEYGVAGQSIVSEACLLAAPVSFQMVSSSQAEGIEDRTALTSLSARRLAEMVRLGGYVVAMELVAATQAIDLRDGPRLGTGTQVAYDQIRATLPALLDGEAIPIEIDTVIEQVRAGHYRLA